MFASSGASRAIVFLPSSQVLPCVSQRICRAAGQRPRSRGLRPALEVLAHDQRAIALYERAGWHRAGSVAALWARTRDDQRDDHALLYYYLAPD
jgi:ribosomal protein S18 acetylase RimI-like enzyme